MARNFHAKAKEFVASAIYPNIGGPTKDPIVPMKKASATANPEDSLSTISPTIVIQMAFQPIPVNPKIDINNRIIHCCEDERETNPSKEHITTKKKEFMKRTGLLFPWKK